MVGRIANLVLWCAVRNGYHGGGHGRTVSGMWLTAVIVLVILIYICATM